MASGKAHAAASAGAAVYVGAVVAVLQTDIAAGLAAACGCWSGVYLTPDLDVNDTPFVKDEIYAKRRLHEQRPWLGRLWALYWWPYGLLIPHRSALSHFPALGTAGRLLYLFGPLYALLLWTWPAGTAAFHHPYFHAWALGLAASDVLHWLMDLPVFGGRYRRIWDFVRRWYSR